MLQSIYGSALKYIEEGLIFARGDAAEVAWHYKNNDIITFSFNLFNGHFFKV